MLGSNTIALLLGTVALGSIPEIDRLARSTGGRVGVAVVHVESGERFAVRGAERFPMASVYKLPIAIRVLQRVGRGEIALDDTLHLRPTDARHGAPEIARRIGVRGVSLRVDALLGAMISESDNTASDALLRLAGGADSVTACIQALGVRELRIDRSEAETLFAFRGVANPPPPETWTREKLERTSAAVPMRGQRAAVALFLEDPRDTATPNAIADLLVLVQRGAALDSAGTAFLLDALSRTVTGPRRLRGALPPGTPVAHKTGTMVGPPPGTAIVNDAGLVTLPDGTHLAIVVFVTGSRRDLAGTERSIARIARAAYDHWTRRAPMPRG